MFADVTSQNIVGYKNNDMTIEGSNFKTVSFNLVGYNTADIQQIVLDDGGAGSIGWGLEAFTIWYGLPEVVDGSEFLYCDSSLDPEEAQTGYYWGDADGYKQNYVIASGQGVVIECAPDIAINVAGQVPTEKVEFTTVEGSNFSGNPYSAAIDISNVTIDDGGAGSIGWGLEAFAIWYGLPEVLEGSEFLYCDPSLDPEEAQAGYYWGDAEGYKKPYSIAPGQGFVIECAEGLTVTIEPPYSL